MENPYHAQRLPEKLKLFTVGVYAFFYHQTHSLQHATSLGGVESLIEQRKHSSEKDDIRLLRISVGIEDIEVRL